MEKLTREAISTTLQENTPEGVKKKSRVGDKERGCRNQGLKEFISTELFILINADAIFDVDFNRMIEYYKLHSALVTLFTHLNFHPYDSGLIVADDKKRVMSG